MVDSIHWERFLSEYFCFALLVTSHEQALLTFSFMFLLLEGKAGEHWETFKHENEFSDAGKHLPENSFMFLSHFKTSQQISIIVKYILLRGINS
jgi:hypothetical protein